MRPPEDRPAAPAPIRPPETGRFLRREGNLLVRRERHRQNLARVLWRVAWISAAVGLVALLAGQAARWSVTTPLLAAATIEIEGARNADVEALRAAARDALDGNLFGADLDRVAQAVRRHAWVGRVQVQRRLPGTLVVRIEESVPCALLVLHGEAFLIDTAGARIDRYRPRYAAWSFPVLRGLDGLPTAERLRRCRRAASELARLQSGAPALYERLTEADLSDPGVVVLLLEGIPERLRAAPEDWTRNLDSYLALRPLLIERHAALQYVDLRWNGRLAVLPEPEAEGSVDDGKAPRGGAARARIS